MRLGEGQSGRDCHARDRGQSCGENESLIQADGEHGFSPREFGSQLRWPEQSAILMVRIAMDWPEDTHSGHHKNMTNVMFLEKT